VGLKALTVLSELHMICSINERIMAYFKLLPGGTEENNEKLHQYGHPLGQKLNPGLSKMWN
jgi:hypothetical protein